MGMLAFPPDTHISPYKVMPAPSSRFLLALRIKGPVGWLIGCCQLLRACLSLLP
jgi:hypothetical protein